MMMTLKATFAAMFCAIAVAPAVQGSVLFHNGDPDGVSFRLNHNVVGSFVNKVYEDFAVPTGESWLVTGAYAYIADPLPSATRGLSWEIRTDMTDASLGTVVASGTTAADYSEPLGYAVGGWNAYYVSTTFDTAIELDDGQTYWLAVYPERNTYNTAILRANGNVNAINSLENSFSRYDTWSWYPAPDGTSNYTSNTDDYAMGLLGVPEPASLSLLAVGGMWLITHRRRALARA